VRIFYVTQAEVSPPTFVFFVNDPQLIHFSYERYLENTLRDTFGFEGTAIRLHFRARTSEQEDQREQRGKSGNKAGKGDQGNRSKAGHGGRHR
jgi:hypothetical protein